MRLRMLAVVVALVVGCIPPPYNVRRGDEAYKRGDYAEAIKLYEREKFYHPSKELDEKIAAAKARQVETELKPIETAFSEGRFDDGVTGLLQLDAEQRKQPAVDAFAKKQEKRLRDELAARAGKKQWGSAFVLATRAVKVFPSLADSVSEYGRNWTDALRPAIADADAKKHAGSGVVLRAALAVVTGDANDRSQAKRALDDLRRQYRLAVELKGKGDLARLQSALSANPRVDLSGASASRGKVTITVGAPTDAKNVTRGREVAQVKKGTRAVENPARAQLEGIVQDKEDAVASYKDQRAMEMQSPTRTQANIEGFDYQIEVAQNELDDARANLKAEPATIQEDNIVEVPFEVETHTLTVARDVSVEVAAPWKGDLAVQRDTVKLTKSDKAHAANSEAQVGRDPAELPAPSALGPELDQAVAKWIDGAVLKVAGQYYRHLLVENEQGDRVALVIVLFPDGAHKGHVNDLEKATGVPMGDRLVTALAEDKLATAFDEPAGAAKPAGSKVAAKPTGSKPGAPTGSKPAPTGSKPAPTPTGSKPTPTPTGSAITKPGVGPTASKPEPAPAPADPMLAKAGYALTIAPFTMKRADKVVLEVDSTGTMRSGATVIGVLRPNGVIEDPRGKIVLAIDKKGELWMPRQGASSGKLSSSSLTFGAGATMTFDGAGHVRLANNKAVQVSDAVLSPNTAKVKPIALLVAWLGVGKLGMRAGK